MAETETEQPYKEAEDGTVLVPLKLAHPMAKVFAQRARVENPKDYKVGDTVWVSREYGNALIDAGMVQIDPVDAEARQTALLLNRRNMPLTAKELQEVTAAAAEGEGEGDAAASVAARTEKPQSAPDAPSAEAKAAPKGKQ